MASKDEQTTMEASEEHTSEQSTPCEPVVAYLGPQSSYTHQVVDLYRRQIPAWSIGLTCLDFAKATIQRFHKTNFVLEPYGSIEDIFEAVQSGEVARGVVPYENSTNGSVLFTLELLADRNGRFSDIMICNESYLDVRHYLLGHKAPPSSSSESPISGTCTPTSATPSPPISRTRPLSSLVHVKRIYTHPQAFGQCEIFLGAYLKGIERIEVSSTSRAAEMAKDDSTGTSVAIASSLAAEIHGLDVLAAGIEDKEDNTTRFIVLRKGVDKDAFDHEDETPTKSLVSFTVDHLLIGSLVSALDCFRQYDLNLTNFASRPTKVHPFQYIFFVEFEGSRYKDPYGKVENLLRLLPDYTTSFRWLGSWDSMLCIRP